MGSLACPESPTAVPGVARVPGVPTAMPRVPLPCPGPPHRPDKTQRPQPRQRRREFCCYSIESSLAIVPSTALLLVQRKHESIDLRGHIELLASEVHTQSQRGLADLVMDSALSNLEVLTH